MSEQLRRSQAQEERLSNKLFKGRQQPRSGAGVFRKADVRSDRFLYECKRTDNKRSITIKAADLEKLRQQALREGRSPALPFELNGRHYIILTEDDFLQETGEG